jgi:hypothetical protein
MDGSDLRAHALEDSEMSCMAHRSACLGPSMHGGHTGRGTFELLCSYLHIARRTPRDPATDYRPFWPVSMPRPLVGP